MKIAKRDGEDVYKDDDRWSMCYMDWLKFTRLYVAVTISVEWRSHEIDIVTVTYRRSEF